MDAIAPSNSYPLTQEEQEILLQLRKRIRSRMDGVMASSMRDKGIDYSYNLGLSIPQIRELAEGLPTTLSFAEHLLATRSRELKIIGLILYPTEELTKERAMALLEELPTQELKDIYAHHFLSSLEPHSPIWTTLWQEGAARPEIIAALTRKLLLQLPIEPTFVQTVLQEIVKTHSISLPFTSIEISFLERLALHPDFSTLLNTYITQWQEHQDEELRGVASYLSDALILAQEGERK